MGNPFSNLNFITSLTVGVLLIASTAPLAAETTCSGKWRGKYNSNFVFNDAGTSVVYNIDDEQFEAVPVTQKPKHLEFKVGTRGAKITIRRQGKQLWAKYSYQGNGTRTKLNCPAGFTLPIVG